jgi:hypothetical protein
MASPRGFDSAEADEAARSSLLDDDLAAARNRRRRAATGGDDATSTSYEHDVEKPFRASDLTAAFPPRPVPHHTIPAVGGGDGGDVYASGAGADVAGGGLGVSALLPSFR